MVQLRKLYEQLAQRILLEYFLSFPPCAAPLFNLLCRDNGKPQAAPWKEAMRSEYQKNSRCCFYAAPSPRSGSPQEKTGRGSPSASTASRKFQLGKLKEFCLAEELASRNIAQPTMHAQLPSSEGDGDGASLPSPTGERMLSILCSCSCADASRETRPKASEKRAKNRYRTNERVKNRAGGGEERGKEQGDKERGIANTYIRTYVLRAVCHSLTDYPSLEGTYRLDFSPTGSLPISVPGGDGAYVAGTGTDVSHSSDGTYIIMC
jgi:hypothetical protein